MPKTLMLDLPGRAVPYAYQMPDILYKRFKHLEGIPLKDPKAPDHIEKWIEDNQWYWR